MSDKSKAKTRKLPSTAFAEGNDFRFEPGVSGNPSGRSGGTKRRLISRALHEQLGRRAPDKVALQFGLSAGSSWAQCISMSLIYSAIRGDISAAREIRDAVGDVRRPGELFDLPSTAQRAIVVEFIRPGQGLTKADEPATLEGVTLAE